MNLLRSIFRQTLNNVIFGVGVMVLTGLYIAIGSGVPRVRELFEMNEMQFFNAWPLKVLMALLVLNLATVTWIRIPLTWPRLGVWMIHTGIVTLVLGMAFYYKLKVEGQIYVSRGQTVTGFYDAQVRSLYLRMTGMGDPKTRLSLELPSLPRFKTYQAEGDRAIRPDLKDIPLAYQVGGKDGKAEMRNIAREDFKLPHDITFDVIAYHPYANIVTDYEPAPAGGVTGVRVDMPDPHANKTSRTWLVATDPQHRAVDFGGLTIEHWHQPMIPVEKLTESAGQLHRLDVAVGDYKQSLFVKMGETYEIGPTGYSFKVENFNPAFPMSGTGEMVKILTVLVKNTTPGKVAEFRRMVIHGKPEIQTDFKLNEPGAGPMGKRQKEPLDKDLVLTYSLNDPHGLMPKDGGERHILVTGEKGPITHVKASLDSGVSAGPLGEGGTFQVGPAEGGMKLTATRFDNVVRSDRVVEVPSAQRQRLVGESGAAQVITLRVKAGPWSKVVHVPFVSWAMEPVGFWGESQPLEVPGVPARIQLGLGHTRRPMPATLTLEDFKLVNYPGGTINDNLFRDFISTLRIVDTDTGAQTVGRAQMNSPIYFDGGRWLFFQSGYDKQNMSTIIGVGNRPGVGVMTAGCVLMSVGLLYAFYLKPVIIRKRKERALREAGVRVNGNKEPETAGIR